MTLVEATTTGIHALPPELFLQIVDQIPLYARPHTLLSLALCSHYYSQIILPSIIYQHIILRDEASLLAVVDVICQNTELRPCIRSLHIRAFLTRVVQNGEFPAMTKLRELFEATSLLGLCTMELCLGRLEYGVPVMCDGFNPYSWLGDSFWASLSGCCPNLRRLDIKHHGRLSSPEVTDQRNMFPWNRTSFLNHFKLTHLSLALSPHSGGWNRDHPDDIVKCIAPLSPQLRMLHLSRVTGSGRPISRWSMVAEGILALTFPCLEFFTLKAGGARDSNVLAAQFWERHPQLRFVDVDRGKSDPIFPSGSLSPILPNLRYLTARVVDIKCVESRLPDLVALAVLNTTAEEFTDLAQKLTSTKLNSLRILRFSRFDFTWDVFSATNNRIGPSFGDFLIRVVPNIEEIIIESGEGWDSYAKLLSLLGPLKRLKRFFFPGEPLSHETRDNVLVSLVQAAAMACPSLEAVGYLLHGIPGSFPTGLVRRGDGEIRVEVTTGPASLLFMDDEALPT
ncbi:hypothetical protein BKA70DRAFT_1337358 [Coprinopsis sp. MPI-PUGE-AT-0042]|nr:hypothetical protein BKA70DRAFT_1337358 [Coprinopsis sp. MPI-PUGE-AT-0042]